MERMLSVLSMIVRIWSTVKFGMAAFGTDPGAIGNGGWRVCPVDFSPSKIRPLELLRQRRWWDICWAEQELPCWDFLQQHQKGFLFNPIYIFHSWWWHLDVSCRFETNSSVATDLKIFSNKPSFVLFKTLFATDQCAMSDHVMRHGFRNLLATGSFVGGGPTHHCDRRLKLSRQRVMSSLKTQANQRHLWWCWSLHGSDILKQNTLSEAVPLRSGEVKLRHSCQPQLI